MLRFLAVDAGGTSTRAVALDAYGRTSGYGRAGSGNPTAVGIEAAVAAIGRAAEQALASRETPDPEPRLAAIAMAGQQSPVFLERLTARLAPLGVDRVSLQPDLLGIFHSGTHELDGCALIAGTGSVAARIREGRLDRVVGGNGWLLGDGGSGFWIGQRVARAVTAALDGLGPPTALTGLVLASLGIDPGLDGVRGRNGAVRELVDALYARPPVELAAFAPLAFTAYADPVARAILVEASADLAALLAAVLDPAVPGPVVGGGSVLVHGMLAAPPALRQDLAPLAGGADIIPVPDGLVGAAVLVLRLAGIPVDAPLFATLQTQVRAPVP